MSSGLDVAREEEQEEYERLCGGINSQCEDLVDNLSKRPVAVLTVKDIEFLLHPHGPYQYANAHWTLDKISRLEEIKQKLDREDV